MTLWPVGWASLSFFISRFRSRSDSFPPVQSRCFEDLRNLCPVLGEDQGSGQRAVFPLVTSIIMEPSRGQQR